MYQVFAFAQAEPPPFFTLDGRLFSAGSSTEPLLDGSVVLTIQILNPLKTCILYEETETVSTLATNGFFTARVGSITSAPERTALDSNNSMKTVFVNSGLAITGQTQLGAGCTYTPLAGETRQFRFFISPSTVGGTAQLSEDMVVDSVPQALVAQTLQGLDPSNIFQTSSTSTQAKLDNLLTTNYGVLSDVISGTSALYLQNDSAGTQLPTRATDPAGPDPGQIWYDTVANEIKYFNGSTVQSIGAAGAGISSLTAGAGLSGGTITTSGTIAIDTAGVTNAMLASGISASKITAGTLPVGVVPTNTDTTKLPLAGGTMTGAVTFGAATTFAGFDLLDAGHITMNAQRTITIGRYDSTQQTTLIAGLTGINAGATWFNTTTGKLMYWNGSAAFEMSETTSSGGDITAITTNTGSGLSGGVTAGPASLSLVVDNSTLEIATNTVQVKDGGITANKLAADSVTTAKILDGEVTSAKINSVSVAKIASAATEYFSYMPAGTECATNEVLKWDAAANRWLCGTDATGATDHGALTGLVDDDHSQYALLAGRTGGQIFYGGIATGDDLTIESTSHATKGDIILQSTSGRVGIGTTGPTEKLAVGGQIVSAQGNGTVGGYSFLGDAGHDTGMFQNTAGTLELQTQGVARIFADSTGNVGIGTTNPQRKLHVEGADALFTNSTKGIHLRTDGSNSYINNMDNFVTNGTTGNGMLYVTGQQGISLRYGSGGPSGAEALKIDSTGNVGIGTSIPGTLLDVAGSVTSRPHGTAAGETGKMILRELAATGSDSATLRAPDAIATSYALTLPIDAGATGQVLRTDGTGVLSWTSATGAISDDSLNFDKLSDTLSLDASTDISATGSTVLSITNSGTGVSLRVNDQAADTTPFVIDASGFVGIGTATPTMHLDINGLVNLATVAGVQKGFIDPANNNFNWYHNINTGYLRVDNGAVSVPSITFQNSLGTGFYRAAADAIGISNAGTENIRITSTGSIGVGTTIPGTRLDVAGAITSRPYGTAAGEAGQLILRELAATGSETATLRAPDSVTTSYVLTLPVDDGTSGQVLVTDGNGLLSWSTPGTATSVNANTGTPAAPSISFTGEADTGFYNSGTNAIGVASGGAQIFELNTTGLQSPTARGALITTAAGSVTNPTYSFTGDPNTGWYSPAADVIAATTNGTEKVRIESSGRVGIGSISPRVALDVTGAIASAPAVSVATTTVDFATNNISYTTQNCQAYALWNLKDGASYTFAVQGTTAATCSFTAFSGSGSGALTVRMPPGHGATTSTQQTMYSFIVAGSTVYVAWIPGY